MKKFLLVLIIPILLISCNQNDYKADAFGNFEATEIIVSAETQGRIVQFNYNEGQFINENEVICIIDTSALYLQKAEINANINSIKASLQNINPQIEVYNQQIQYLENEKNRIVSLIKGNAATQKQFDEIESKIEASKKQKQALVSKLSDGNKAKLSKIEPLEIKLLQIQDMINKSIIKSPISGNLLEKYFEEGEFARPSAGLFKIANLNKIFLRAYISENQLATFKINQNVKIRIDDGDSQKEFDGRISYVSDKAEFTPKTIQTKEERINLVYEVKIEVINDGSIKIGMPGEVKL